MAQATDDFSRANLVFQLGTNADLILGSPDVENHGTQESHRILYLTEGSSSATVLDTSNGVGAGGDRFQDDGHLRFDRGDLRVAFPGSVEAQLSVANDLGGGVSDLECRASIAIHYIPSDRHP
jgi:hypothetical protein